VNHIVSGTDVSNPVGNQVPVSTIPRLWLVAITVLVFPLLKYGLSNSTDNGAFSSLGIILALFAGIYAYRGIAELGAARKLLLGFSLIALATIIGAVSAPPSMALMAVANVLLIGLAAGTVGWRSLKDHSQSRLYVIGLAIVFAGGFVMYQSSWSMLIFGFNAMGADMLQNMRPALISSGFSEVQAVEWIEQMTRSLALLARLLPSITLMYLAMQYSLGFLWFMSLGVSQSSASGSLRPFTAWKMPFALMPVLIVILAARLMGGESVKLVSDNLLAMLSVWYCVGGLALVQYGLKRLRINVGVKIAVYVLILLSGLFGYFVLVLAAFVDSFADWRKRLAVSDLDKKE